MGGMDWAGSWFACNGHYTIAFPPESRKIISKYKPIAPKPSLVTFVHYEPVSNSKSDNALNPSLRFNSLKRSNGSERSNRKSRRASEFCNSPSQRGRRKTRAPCRPAYLGSKTSPMVETVPARILADRSKIEHPLDGCLDKSSVVKDLGFMERGSNSFRSSSVFDKESAVFGEELELNEKMDSMREDPECGLGFAKCFVLPSDIQKHHEEVKNWRNLKTLPLLPETSASKDSDMGSCAANSTSNSNSSYDKEKFRLRIFGKDFSN